MYKDYSRNCNCKTDEQIEREARTMIEIAKTMALWLIFMTLYWHWF